MVFFHSGKEDTFVSYDDLLHRINTVNSYSGIVDEANPLEFFIKLLVNACYNVDSIIVDREYHVFPNTCMTVCCLTLKNGFSVVGESACASPKNFNAQIGENIAFRNARDKIWMLEGYLLKQKLFEG
mgnify:CR=1 FL=1